MKQITKDTVLKQGNKSYSAIEVEQGIVWVDKDVKLVDGNMHIEKELVINVFPDYLTDLDECDKIIAATFVLSGVPKIELDDEIKGLTDRCINMLTELNPKGGIKEFIRMAVEFGYKANKARYTEEQMFKAFSEICITQNDQIIENKFKAFLQSLNSIKEITVDKNFKII